ncbi:hypothetical protein [Frigidibacter sp. MR17.24]|uniref:hypothetical protein n=1 Tax=Frigidibacter sp. MR17.24 TaxID=3127345 RepID=UPI00301309C5
MPLKYQLASLDEADEAVRALYKEKDGKFVLDLDGGPQSEDVTGLKAKVAELMGETKAEREKRQALEAKQAEDEAERQRKAGEFQSLYEKAQSDLNAEREAHATTRGSIAKRDMAAAAHALGVELTRDAAKADVLKGLAAPFLKHGEGGVTYEIGGVTVEKAKVLEHLRATYPFLVDGNQSNGGGAPGGSGGAATEKLADLSEAERRDLQAKDPQKFRRLLAEAQRR